MIFSELIEGDIAVFSVDTFASKSSWKEDGWVGSESSLAVTT